MEFISLLKNFDQFVINSTGHYKKERWIGLFALAFLYLLRALAIRTHFLITYFIICYAVHGIIYWCTPKADKRFQNAFPDIVDENNLDQDEECEEQELNFNEYLFVRNMPEFQLWYFLIKIVFTGFILTFFNIFDIPVFVPMLLAICLISMILYTAENYMYIVKNISIILSISHLLKCLKINYNKFNKMKYCEFE